jgi:hypothetical protein
MCSSRAQTRMMSTLDEPVACQQSVEAQDDERSGRSDPEAYWTYGGNRMSLEEEGNDPTADHRSYNPHRHRRDRASRVGAGHDRLGQQSDNGSEPNPDENQVRSVLQVFHHLHIEVHDSLLRQKRWDSSHRYRQLYLLEFDDNCGRFRVCA